MSSRSDTPGKTRLAVVGTDLKFITPLLERIETTGRFEIRVDEWPKFRAHEKALGRDPFVDDLRLDVWLGYLMPVEREFVTPEFVKLGARLACAEMIRAGVTTFADMDRLGARWFNSHCGCRTSRPCGW